MPPYLVSRTGEGDPLSFISIRNINTRSKESDPYAIKIRAGTPFVCSNVIIHSMRQRACFFSTFPTLPKWQIGFSWAKDHSFAFQHDFFMKRENASYLLCHFILQIFSLTRGNLKHVEDVLPMPSIVKVMPSSNTHTLQV